MRKIEQQMIRALTLPLNWSKDNTEVYYISAKESGNPHGARAEIYLHNNHIATYWYEYKALGKQALEVNVETLKRYPTVTTKSRLRALGADLVSRKGKLFLNGKEV
jgi:hypothetical protein